MLDSGAAMSCISKTAFDRDVKFLSQTGQLRTLATGMSVSGFDANHTKVTQVLHDVVVIFGNVATGFNLVIIPNLICDYMLGHDFMVSYEVQLNYSRSRMYMQVFPQEWIGDDHAPARQGVEMTWVGQKALFKVLPR